MERLIERTETKNVTMSLASTSKRDPGMVSPSSARCIEMASLSINTEIPLINLPTKRKFKQGIRTEHRCLNGCWDIQPKSQIDRLKADYLCKYKTPQTQLKPTKFLGALHAPVTKYFSFFAANVYFQSMADHFSFELGRLSDSNYMSGQIKWVKRNYDDSLETQLPLLNTWRLAIWHDNDTKKLAYKIFTEVILIWSLHDKKKHAHGL